MGKKVKLDGSGHRTVIEISDVRIVPFDVAKVYRMKIKELRRRRRMTAIKSFLSKLGFPIST